MDSLEGAAESSDVVYLLLITTPLPAEGRTLWSMSATARRPPGKPSLPCVRRPSRGTLDPHGNASSMSADAPRGESVDQTPGDFGEAVDLVVAATDR